MQRRVLFGAGLAALAVAGYLAIRSTTNRRVETAVDDGIAQFIARLPPGYAVRHGATEANMLTNALTVHDVVVSRDGVTLVTAGQVTVSGADGRALQDVFDPAAYPDGHPAWTDRRLLIADATATNLHVTVQGGDSTQRSYSLHRLAGRPFMMPPTRRNLMQPAFLADAALAFSLDSASGHDAVTTSPGRPQVTTRLGSVALSDYDSGKVGSLAGKDFAIAGDARPHGGPFHAALASLELKSLDVRAVLEQIRRTGHADRGQLGAVTYETADMSGLVFDADGGPHFVLDASHASQTPTGTGSAGQGYLHGFTLALGQMKPPPGLAAGLAAFGMTSLTLDVDATTLTSTAGGRTELHEDLALHDLGKLHVDATVSGYDAALASPANPLGAVLGTTLEQAAVVYEDGSLVGRMVAVAAAQTGRTPEEVRKKMAIPVATLGLILPDQPDAADQVTAFLDHPGTLTITVRPPEKITLAQIAQAPIFARAHLLGVHVTSK